MLTVAAAAAAEKVEDNLHQQQMEVSIARNAEDVHVEEEGTGPLGCRSMYWAKWRST